MADDLIRYDLLVQDALRSVVRKVIGDAARDGLMGEHHFYVSFRTDYPGVRISQRLREKYPQDMTIVLQHQFWDLGVTEHTFEVGLSFSGVPERLLVPFEAVTGFFDPSVQFGLKFELNDGTGGEEAAAPAAGAAPTLRAIRGAGSEPAEAAPKVPAIAASVPKLPATTPEKPAAAEAETPEADAPAEGGASVVSLDAFRKKN
ncbi:SspB family protein [Methylobacterium oryzihabitans]|uniref:Stringent starvation protein B n=1 Tax=Methylobacterium oryzihabitans TaxID=2499852 RepID=A0A3S2YUJ3_9HYPH|nr:ClpXP protease specificity-enhancing factor SspB [Methylobacterium oryzihabitans]RVU19716.1 Stringent starvation protein B [Methylobacterium oryzihabitans]